MSKVSWSGPGWYARDRYGYERPVPGTGRFGKNRFYDARRYAERQKLNGVRWIDVQPVEQGELS